MQDPPLSFLSLPSELIELVLLLLDVHSLNSMARTCRRLNGVVTNSRRIWKELCRQTRRTTDLSDIGVESYVSSLATLSREMPTAIPHYKEKYFLAKYLDLRRVQRSGRRQHWKMLRGAERIERVHPRIDSVAVREAQESILGSRDKSRDFVFSGRWAVWKGKSDNVFRACRIGGKEMKPHSDYKQFEGSEFGRGNAFAIWNDCVLAVECPNRAPSLFLKMRDMEEGSQKRMQILRGHHRHFIDDEETVVCRVIESDTCIIGIFPKNATDALFCDVNLAQWREIHNWRICWKTPEEQYELMAQSANNNLVFVLRNKDPTSGAKFKMITCWQNKTGFSHSVMNPQPNSTCLSADCCNRTNSVLTLEATDDGRTHMKSYTRVLGPRYSNVEFTERRLHEFDLAGRGFANRSKCQGNLNSTAGLRLCPGALPGGENVAVCLTLKTDEFNSSVSGKTVHGLSVSADLLSAHILYRIDLATVTPVVSAADSIEFAVGAEIFVVFTKSGKERFLRVFDTADGNELQTISLSGEKKERLLSQTGSDLKYLYTNDSSIVVHYAHRKDCMADVIKFW